MTQRTHNFFTNWVSICILVLFGAPFFDAEAAAFKAGEVLELTQGEVLDDDVFAAGAQITVGADIEHDAILAGNIVKVPGEVRQDLIVVGSDVNISGVIGDDLRAAGSVIEIDALVGDDITVAGGDVQIQPGSHIGGGVYIFGGRVIINGTVDGETRIAADIIEINGRLEGPVLLHGANIVIGDKAVIYGDLEYTSTKKATISQGATIQGEVDFIREETAGVTGVQGFFVILFGGLFLLKFLSFLIMSLLLLYLFPAFVHRLLGFAVNRGAVAVITGLASWVAFPVLLLLLVMSILGIALAFGLLGVGIAVWALASILSNIMAGALLSQWIRGTAILDWKWTIIGALALEFIVLVPLVGWFINMLVLFAVTGAIIYAMYESWWKPRKDFDEMAEASEEPVEQTEESNTDSGAEESGSKD